MPGAGVQRRAGTGRRSVGAGLLTVAGATPWEGGAQDTAEQLQALIENELQRPASSPAG